MVVSNWNPYTPGTKEWHAHEVAKEYYFTDYNKYLDVYYTTVGVPVPGVDPSIPIAEQYRQLYPEQYTDTKKKPDLLFYVGAVIIAVIVFSVLTKGGK